MMRPEIALLILAGIIASAFSAAIIAMLIDKVFCQAADLVRAWRGRRAT